MTAKHAPGPWVAVGAWVEHSYWDCPDVCSCAPESIGQRGRAYDEQCANARLIAAAPDLLEALKAVMEALIADLPQAEGSPTVQGALAAIAKAEGRA
jgi:hypothetical protein